MNPDLVGPSRLQLAFQESHEAETLKYPVMGDCSLTPVLLLKDPELHPVIWVPADISLDRSFIFLDITPNNGHITAFDAVVEELGGQIQLTGLILGDCKQAAGILVDAVNKDSHPLVLGLRALGDSKMVGKGVYQSPLIMAVSRMHAHSGRFVDHQHIIILINYVKWNVLRQYLQSPPAIWHHKTDDVARAHDVVGLDDFVTYVHITLFEGLLDAATGSVLKVRGHILVNTHRRLALVNFKPEMFEKFFFHPLSFSGRDLAKVGCKTERDFRSHSHGLASC